MISIKATYNRNPLWTALDKQVSLPLVEVAEFLARIIVARRKAARGPSGPAPPMKDGSARDYHATGDLWSRLRVKAMTPDHVKIFFMGKHRQSGLRAKRLAEVLSWRDSAGLLTPSADELKQAKAMLLERMDASMRQASGIAARSFTTRKDAANLVAKARRVLKRANR